ncbi:P-loop NTPase [Rarobacter incanus]|uniref:Iron-sulfur cluster carrier protein n=1 Tax=Rarobacter incanus TaxID=153494 RepID=A0A542SRC2_9MICO|nr:P-loop NTPase [Rarobacter incanus]TQK77153.1 ATP-binding protein involved in chromosome partitioning [Rarobacter incanus]
METPAQNTVIARVRDALSTVDDPEIRRPITELGMVRRVALDPADPTRVQIGIDLTQAGCPLRADLGDAVTRAALSVPGVGHVDIDFGVMTPAQRSQLRITLRGTDGRAPNPFADPGSLTRIFAIASGKGGVGKSTMTANLAAAMAADGLSVGVIDADIHGFSLPLMLGSTAQPTRIDAMLIPPVIHGIKLVSIGMFTPPGRAVVWRGPMLHRTLEQFLGDVFWGDLDVLLLDLPPGTGDMAISVAQLLPTSQLVVVTTPQIAAADVAMRAGALAVQTSQRVAGVVENMSWLQAPDGSRMEIFGRGGGELVAGRLAQSLGSPVPLLGQVPLDTAIREGGDSGLPVVLGNPQSAAAQAITRVARALTSRPRGLPGQSLPISPL